MDNIEPESRRRFNSGIYLEAYFGGHGMTTKSVCCITDRVVDENAEWSCVHQCSLETNTIS
jgi:hypothetical protein